jgi:hypothetical protein
MTDKQKPAPSIMDLEMLTPGSVWTRKDGKQARYLFTTNTTVPATHSHIYPSVAVFADENDDYFSVPVEDFIARRTFYNVDPGLEARLNNLLAFDADSTSEDFDLLNDADESLVVSDDDSFTATVGDGVTDIVADESNEVSAAQQPDPDASLNPALNMFPVEYSSEGSALPEIIPGYILASHTQGYQQQPLMTETGFTKIVHTLFIKATKEITHDKLYACFSPTHLERNAVFTFKVSTADGLLDVDWDAMIGVFPYVFMNEQVFQVMFLSDSELKYERVEEEPAVEFVASTDPADGHVVIAAAEAASTYSSDFDTPGIPASILIDESPVVAPGVDPNAAPVAQGFVVTAG